MLVMVLAPRRPRSLSPSRAAAPPKVRVHKARGRCRGRHGGPWHRHCCLTLATSHPLCPSAQCLPTNPDRVLIPHSGRRADLGSELRGCRAAPGHHYVVQARGQSSGPAPGTEWSLAVRAALLPPGVDRAGTAPRAKNPKREPAILGQFSLLPGTDGENLSTSDKGGLGGGLTPLLTS